MSGNPKKENNRKRLEAIASLLREYRFAYGLSQNELSQHLQLHRNSISRIEHSKNYTILSLFELIDYYNIPIREIFQDLD